jgi:hypothetical protein
MKKNMRSISISIQNRYEYHKKIMRVPHVIHPYPREFRTRSSESPCPDFTAPPPPSLRRAWRLHPRSRPSTVAPSPRPRSPPPQRSPSSTPATMRSPASRAQHPQIESHQAQVPTAASLCSVHLLRG